MCVTCEQTNTVWMRVQTNSMPNHCYSASADLEYAPVYYNWDWTVEWNKDVYHWDNYGSGEVDTQAELDSLMCDHTVTEHQNLPGYGITFSQGADLERGVGVTIGNMLIFNSLTDYSQDTIDSDTL